MLLVQRHMCASNLTLPPSTGFHPLHAPPPHTPHTTPPAGKSGKTKFTVENATRTRVVLADTKIHILGSFQNIRAARDAICALILGSPAGKVYSKLHSVTARLSQSY